MSGWPRVPLGDLVVEERPRRSDADSYVWNLNLDQIESGTGRVLERVRVLPSNLGPSTYPFSTGTVLYSKLRPYLNKVVVADEAGYATTELVSLRCDPQKVLPSYLAHFLRSDVFLSFANTVVAGAKMPRMVMSEFWKYQAPLPPLAEQRRIAAVLDKADALRNKRREALAQLDRLAQSIFEAVMQRAQSERCVQVAMLDDVFWFQEGPGVRKWQFTNAGVKLLNVGNIQKNGILDLAKTDRHVAEQEAHGKYKHFLCDAGDLVIASSGISIQEDGLLATRGAFVENHHLPLCMNTSTIRFKSQGESSLDFLRAWLASLEFRAQITKLVTGSAQLNFGPSHLRELKISLPSKELQDFITSTLRALQSRRSLYEKAYQTTEELSLSLKRRAFSREI